MSRLSSRPTKAKVAATGPMMVRVSQVSGTVGIWKNGRVEGIWPMSPTVRTSMPLQITKPLSRTMATSGEGTALVMRGRP